MRKLIAVIAAALILSACEHKVEQGHEYNSEQTKSPKQGFDTRDLAAVMANYTTEKDFMGSVVISKGGQPVYSYVTGYSDYENKTLATPATKYRIGSVTKTFTALLVLLAVEEGKLSLSDTLDKFYPAIASADTITITHILNHRSGLPSYTRDPDFKDFVYKGITREAMMVRFQSYETQFKSGSQEAYSNTAIYLMSLILEDIYQKPYATLIQDKLAVPLDLADTYYGEVVSASNGEAYSYHTAKGGKERLQRSQDFHHSTMLGAGGMISTPADLLKLYNALFAGKILQDETLDQMLDIDKNFGLGIEKMTYTGRVSYGHRGRVAEYNTIVLYHPAEKIGIAITDNSSFTDIPSLVKDLLGAYFKSEIVSISTEALEKFEGSYQGVKAPSDISVFERKGDKLIHVIKGEFREELVYKGENNFLLDQSYAPAIIFSFYDNGQKMIFKQQNTSFDYVKQQ